MKQLKELLDKFDFVEWDRYIESPHIYALYGWIPRKDKKRDFILLSWHRQWAKPIAHVTSSAKWDKKVCEILEVEGTKCKKIKSLLE